MKKKAIGHLVKTNPIKANSKPNKANLPEGKIDAKCVFTKDYERNDIFAVPENKAKTKPIQTQFPKSPK